MNSKKRQFSLKTPVKWLSIIFLLLAYLVTSGLISVVPISRRFRRAVRVRNTSIFSALALIVFGVRVHVKRRERSNTRDTGRLVISNHVSYIDILVISSLAPSVFITSEELKNTPLLGMLARFGGSLFVERRKRSGLKKEIADISKVLCENFSIVLFPEGTTSNGEGVSHFKNSLFDAAVSAGVDILPLCLRYTAINQQAISAGNKDKLYYYGGVSFSKHFPGFLSLSSVDVDVIPLNRIKVGEDTSRKELAAQAHMAISAAYRTG